MFYRHAGLGKASAIYITDCMDRALILGTLHCKSFHFHYPKSRAQHYAALTYVVSMPNVSAVNHFVQIPHCSSISPSCRPFSSSTEPA